MIDTIKFWMELGVSGFRIDAVAHFFEGKLSRLLAGSINTVHITVNRISDESFSDEPLNKEAGDGVKPNDYGYLEHKYTFNQPENIGLIQKFRHVLDEKTAEDPKNPRYYFLSEKYEMPVGPYISKTFCSLQDYANRSLSTLGRTDKVLRINGERSQWYHFTDAFEFWANNRFQRSFASYC